MYKNIDFSYIGWESTVQLREICNSKAIAAQYYMIVMANEVDGPALSDGVDPDEGRWMAG